MNSNLKGTLSRLDTARSERSLLSAGQDLLPPDTHSHLVPLHPQQEACRAQRQSIALLTCLVAEHERREQFYQTMLRQKEAQLRLMRSPQSKSAEDSLLKTVQAVERARQQSIARQAQLSSALSQRTAQLSRLQAQAVSRDQQLRQLRTQNRSMSKTIALLESALSKYQQFELESTKKEMASLQKRGKIRAKLTGLLAGVPFLRKELAGARQMAVSLAKIDELESEACRQLSQMLPRLHMALWTVPQAS